MNNKIKASKNFQFNKMKVVILASLYINHPKTTESLNISI
jgi:hypothetical protein